MKTITIATLLLLTSTAFAQAPPHYVRYSQRITNVPSTAAEAARTLTLITREVTLLTVVVHLDVAAATAIRMDVAGRVVPGGLWGSAMTLTPLDGDISSHYKTFYHATPGPGLYEIAWDIPVASFVETRLIFSANGPTAADIFNVEVIGSSGGHAPDSTVEGRLRVGINHEGSQHAVGETRPLATRLSDGVAYLLTVLGISTSARPAPLADAERVLGVMPFGRTSNTVKTAMLVDAAGRMQANTSPVLTALTDLRESMSLVPATDPEFDRTLFIDTSTYSGLSITINLAWVAATDLTMVVRSRATPGGLWGRQHSLAIAGGVVTLSPVTYTRTVAGDTEITIELPVQKIAAVELIFNAVGGGATDLISVQTAGVQGE